MVHHFVPLGSSGIFGFHLQLWGDIQKSQLLNVHVDLPRSANPAQMGTIPLQEGKVCYSDFPKRREANTCGNRKLTHLRGPFVLDIINLTQAGQPRHRQGW